MIDLFELYQTNFFPEKAERLANVFCDSLVVIHQLWITQIR